MSLTAPARDEFARHADALMAPGGGVAGSVAGGRRVLVTRLQYLADEVSEKRRNHMGVRRRKYGTQRGN